MGAIGHTHVALPFTRTDGDVGGRQVEGGTELDLSAGEWLINPGSVGQPRDGDPRAAWLLLDTEQLDRATGDRVRVPDRRGRGGHRGRGLPRSLGERLFIGQ